jgi:hypothetical protein
MKVLRGGAGEWVLFGALVGGLTLALTVGRGLGGAATRQALEVTIVPADAEGLGCSGGHDELRCGFDEAGAPVSVLVPLRPFVSTGGQLLLVRGLFESPGVRRWLEGAGGKGERVRVRCDARVLARDLEVRVRFGPGEAFGPSSRVLALEAEGCDILR